MQAMPTYSYRCGACAHSFDLVQRITADPIKLCPSCGVEAATRIITSGNFILKGGGWYSDLYASGANKKPDDATAKSADAKGDDAKGDAAKPAGGDAASAPTPSGDSSSSAPASTPAAPPPSSTPSSNTPSST